MRSFTPLRTDIKAVNGAGDLFAAGTIAALTAARSLNDVDTLRPRRRGA